MNDRWKNWRGTALMSHEGWLVVLPPACSIRRELKSASQAERVFEEQKTSWGFPLVFLLQAQRQMVQYPYSSAEQVAKQPPQPW
jgi:hypothetical protein